MKKARVFFYLDADIKRRLEDLSRKTKAPMGEYIHEALGDLLEKYESPRLERIDESRLHVDVGHDGVDKTSFIGGG